MKDEDYDELYLKTFLEASSLSLEQISERLQVNEDPLQLLEDSQEQMYAALAAKVGAARVKELKARNAVKRERLEAGMNALRSKIGNGSDTPS